MLEQSINQPVAAKDAPAMASQTPLAYAPASESRISPQAGNGDCGCGGGMESTNLPVYVYAIGKIGWHFPRPSIEKEFAQATGRTEIVGLTGQQAFHEILSQRQ